MHVPLLGHIGLAGEAPATGVTSSVGAVISALAAPAAEPATKVCLEEAHHMGAKSISNNGLLCSVFMKALGAFHHRGPQQYIK